MNDPTWDLTMIASVDLTPLDQIFDERASRPFAAWSRNRTNPDCCGRGHQPARFGCRPDEQRHIPQPILRPR
jgi:hypothetical protein